MLQTETDKQTDRQRQTDGQTDRDRQTWRKEISIAHHLLCDVH